MIYVTITGTLPKNMLQMMRNVYLRCKKGMEDTAYDARHYMVSIIEHAKKRDGSTGRLENAILVEKIDSYSYGVGNIPFMSQPDVAPYWGLLNAGGMVPPKARKVGGYFGENRPPLSQYAGTGGGTEHWTYMPRDQKSYSGGGLFGGRKFLMIVENPIAPMNYIEQTTNWLRNIMSLRISSWTKTAKYKRNI